MSGKIDNALDDLREILGVLHADPTVRFHYCVEMESALIDFAEIEAYIRRLEKKCNSTTTK